MGKITIAEIPKDQLTHEMLFDLWFEISTQTSKGMPCTIWVKILCYIPQEESYFLELDIHRGYTREQLLDFRYAIKPLKVEVNND